ncbi:MULTISPECIES: hypothetical protein [Enterococcus]|uniref:hypothetical protein n=1 Tax=Enterococcus TaxID=1350 RepID=UPI000A340A0D|nr:hypothetical protein [Enterococcus faecalis]OTP17043.1 hypothetical protein A5830_000811 [Enterococcus faecalis]
MSKYIITADKENQGWLEAFNSWAGHSYQMNQEVNEEHIDRLEINVERFNHEIACGPAIRLEEVE